MTCLLPLPPTCDLPAGASGVELLTDCMNNYFTRVISMIRSFQGDVIKFAGDSMIVAFLPTEEEVAQAAREAGGDPGDPGKDYGLQAATLRCTQCAHMLAMQLGHMRMKLNGQVEPVRKGVGMLREDSTAVVSGMNGLSTMHLAAAVMSGSPRTMPANIVAMNSGAHALMYSSGAAMGPSHLMQGFESLEQEDAAPATLAGALAPGPSSGDAADGPGGLRMPSAIKRRPASAMVPGGKKLDAMLGAFRRVATLARPASPAVTDASTSGGSGSNAVPLSPPLSQPQQQQRSTAAALLTASAAWFESGNSPGSKTATRSAASSAISPSGAAAARGSAKAAAGSGGDRSSAKVSAADAGQAANLFAGEGVSGLTTGSVSGSMWGGAEVGPSVVQRQMLLASRLNLPPPLHGGRSAAGGTAGGAGPSHPLAAPLLGGPGGFLASRDSASPPGSPAMSAAFANLAAGRRDSLDAVAAAGAGHAGGAGGSGGGRSTSPRPVGSITAVTSAPSPLARMARPTESWQSTLRSLASATLQPLSPGTGSPVSAQGQAGGGRHRTEAEGDALPPSPRNPLLTLLPER